MTGLHRSRLARRLLLTKSAFMIGWLSILVALLGAGQVVDVLPRPQLFDDAQLVTPAPPVPAELVKTLAELPAGKGSEPPLMLTYHEISPIENTEYTLTPHQFAEQMRMLFEAGYRTIRTADLVAWMRGAPLPPKSVFISFDDGTAGVWRYADPILAQYGFTGCAFIISSYPGRGPRYMSWRQIERLGRTGRWDIESHTRSGHRYVPVSDNGARDPFLTSRLWVEAEGRKETIAEYRDRVTADLQGSIADLQAHGLPSPQLFSFPFSAAAAPDDREVTEYLTGLTNRLFAASMLDDGTGGVTSPEELARQQLRRLSVLRDHDAARFVAEVVKSSALPAGGVYPFTARGGWAPSSGDGTLRVDKGAVRLTIPARAWKHVAYQPDRTLFWRDYSVSATVTGLDPAGGTAAGISVWTGSPRQVIVSVSSRWVRVKSGSKILHDGRLPTVGDRHRVSVSVSRGRVSVSVDGVAIVHDRAVRSGNGGFGLFGSTERNRAAIRFVNGRIGPAR